MPEKENSTCGAPSSKRVVPLSHLITTNNLNKSPAKGSVNFRKEEINEIDWRGMIGLLLMELSGRDASGVL